MPIIEKFIALIAPHTCLGCGCEGTLLCPACQGKYLLAPPRRCYRCHCYDKDSKTCRACRSSSGLAHVWVGSSYEGLAAALVKRLKFERAQAAAIVMAAHLSRFVGELPPGAIVAHVPTASSRVRRRGYDQAQLLARKLSRRLGLPAANLLTRHGQSRQVGTRRAARLKQLEQAFSVKRPALIAGAHVILVDDVLTTGATLEAAALALKAAGAKKVEAIVFAQA